MRILHAPCNVAGQAGSLARAEREAARQAGLDARSWSVDFYPSAFDFRSDRRMPLEWRLTGRIGRKCISMAYGAHATFRYDIFHFYFAHSFVSFGPRFSRLHLLDLALLSRLGKKCFMTLQGDDARQRKASVSAVPADAKGNDADPYFWLDQGLDEFKRENIRRILRTCKRIFCLNPDLVPLVPGSEFLPYASVDVRAVQPRDRPGQGRGSRPLVLLHAPTNRQIKGTARILEVVEELRKKYILELVLVEGMTQERAIEAYRNADLVIDQIHAGWYGSLAVEVMAMGIPVVAYVAPQHLGHVPNPMRNEIPVVSATPETLPSVLETLVKDAGVLLELGNRSRRYVERWHDPLKIARAMIEVYRNPETKFWDHFLATRG